MAKLITGGTGYIGAELAHILVGQGEEVVLFDIVINEYRIEDIENEVKIICGDLANYSEVLKVVKNNKITDIYHLGSMLTYMSEGNPWGSFNANVIGTFNVLEAARLSDRRPIMVYASTNKVYGGMEDVAVVEQETQYAYRDYPHGIPETYPLDFHSPYGCSKGTGDQYVRDYARIYNLPTVVFRQSCIYGPRQFGVEDQGWVAWFLIAVVTGQPITICGNGKQVRDVLFVDDLLDVYDAAVAHIDVAAGQVYNVGGGPERIMSIWADFGPILERLMGRSIPVSYENWRPGDQRAVVCDVRKAGRELGWRPQVGVEEGIQRLYEWVIANKELFETG